ncbi:MAG: hypothetical protein ACR2GY_12135 [Phycisphaerales bacterium]
MNETERHTAAPNADAAQSDAHTPELAEARQQIAKLLREKQIEAVLQQRGAVDIDVARMLVERALEDAYASQDDNVHAVEAIIDDLAQAKSFLFRDQEQRLPGTSSASAARISESDRPDHIEHAAAEAFAAGGRRTELRRYLQLRRRMFPKRE